MPLVTQLRTSASLKTTIHPLSLSYTFYKTRLSPARTPGRIVESFLGASSCASSVVRFAASVHRSRPGPESSTGLEVSQLAPPGKYNIDYESTSNFSPPDARQSFRTPHDAFRSSSASSAALLKPHFSSAQTGTAARTPGRIVESILGASSCASSVVRFAASVHRSRPGPEPSTGLEVSQLAPPGKYNSDFESSCNISPPDARQSFRTPHDAFRSSSASSAALPDQHLSSTLSGTAARTPGRTVESILGAPSCSGSVASYAASVHRSRPGPEPSSGLGVSHLAKSGKYNCDTEVSSPDTDPNFSSSHYSPTSMSLRPSSSATYSTATSVAAPSVSTVQQHTGRCGNAAPPCPAAGRRDDLLIYYQNVGGLNSCTHDYRLSTSTGSYDMIVMTETWLDDRTLSSHVFGADYEVFRCDRNSRNSRKSTGGGVLIAVRNGLKARIIEKNEWECVEQVWLTVKLKDHALFICAVYFPPDRIRDTDLIESHCCSIRSIIEDATPTDEIIVLGDFNLPGVSWKSSHNGFLYPDCEQSSFHPGALCLLDGYSSATLSQINHVANENHRSLDLCFVSTRDTAPTIFEAPAPLVKHVPHHPPLVVSISEKLVVDFTSSSSSISYDFRKADHSSIVEVLTSIDWDTVLDNDIENAALTFSHVLAYVIDRHVPKKVHRINSHPPWQTRELKKMKSVKRAALRKYSKYRTLPLKDHYIRLNHEFKHASRFCYSRYQQRIQSKLKSHPKAFWSHVNQQRRESGLPSSMTLHDEVASSPQEICHLFAMKFAGMFTAENLNDEQVTLAASNVPLFGQSLSAIDISVGMISTAAVRLKSSFNPGPDGVPSAFLKKHIASLSSPLLHLFQLSISTGTFPSCWKLAHMFPVHKKGSKRNVDNYRGISSLCAISKLFELVILEPLTSHCKQYLSEDQHGFIAGRSTTTNLLCLTSYITESMVLRTQTDVIYTDLSAAFDKLNHEIAIAKLLRLGVNGCLIQWFRSYLTGRQLTVGIGDCRSELFPATSGVPQGSHLGPLLFLLYFNDVNLSLKAPRLSYADDLKIFLRVETINDCHVLQRQLEIFADWCSVNRMVVNPAKCSVVTFSRKKEPLLFDYTLRGTPIERTTHVKDLGVILDSQLTYKLHISYIVDKASKTLGFIFRMTKDFTDIHCLKSLYCSLVRSILEYCSAVWNPNYNNGADRVESVQRRFLRYALRKLPWTNPFRLPSYESRCRLIDLELLRNRRDTSRALLVADVVQGRTDCRSLLERINFNAQPRTLRTNALLRLPLRRTNYSMYGAIGGMQRVFNRVSTLFDFNLTRNMLRRRFSSFFASQ